MIFATDLDGTMIFSHRQVIGLEDELYCVEYYNGNPITYMTHSAIKMLKTLISKIFVIPVTTRSISQFERVEFFSTTEYAIADNGGVILHNGMILSEWDNYIKSILMKYDLKGTCELFSGLPSLILPPKIVDGKFVFAKSDNIDLCREYLKCKLDSKIWQVSYQGKKVYAIPIEITKGNALKYISKNLIHDNQLIVSAGDSNLDVSMLNYSNYGIIPRNSNLSAHNTNGFIETGTGVYSADAILSLVENLSNSF